MKKYVMVGSRGGVILFTSDDGIQWENRPMLFRMTDVPMIGKEFAVHPSLHIERATADEASGFLFYGYTSPADPQRGAGRHAWAKQPITLKLNDSSDSGSMLKDRLAGTKWINSNKVSFEWTEDGRFLHKGIERQWKVLDAHRAQIIFGPNHVGTLVFNDSLTEFKQLIRGGPDFFTGKRSGAR